MEEKVEQIREDAQKEQKQNKSQKKKMTPEERKELKARLIENPMSIVIAPKTEEGYALMDVTFIADKLMWLLRKKVGIVVSPMTFKEISDRMQRYIGTLYNAVGGTSMFHDRHIERNKADLARLVRSKVIIPRTAEGQALANCIRRADAVILQTKLTSRTDTLIERLTTVLGIIKDFHETFIEITEILDGKMTGREKRKYYYRPTYHIRRVLRLLDKKENTNEGNTEQQTDQTY